jgi:DNA-binding transcriptional LysR family regulator
VRDDLNAIPVFVTVVESGNFASAATILHVTRSAVGKTIARLEARLGVALFQRTTRRQLLTEEGEQFYHQCREALGASARPKKRCSAAKARCRDGCGFRCRCCLASAAWRRCCSA